MRHQVRRVVDLPAKAPNHVAVRLAERVGDTLVRIGAKQGCERGWGLDPRGPQIDPLQRHRLLDLLASEPELLPDAGRGRFELGLGKLAVLEPPAPVLSPAGGRLYQ